MSKRIGLRARTQWADATLRRVKAYIISRTIADNVPGWRRTPSGLVPIQKQGNSTAGGGRRPFEIYRGKTTQGTDRVFITPGKILCWSVGTGASDGVPFWIAPTASSTSLENQDGGLPLQAGTWTVYFETTISLQSLDLTLETSADAETVQLTRQRHAISGINIDQAAVKPTDVADSPIGWETTYLELAQYTFDADLNLFQVDIQYAESNFHYVIGDAWEETR